MELAVVEEAAVVMAVAVAVAAAAAGAHCLGNNRQALSLHHRTRPFRVLPRPSRTWRGASTAASDSAE